MTALSLLCLSFLLSIVSYLIFSLLSCKYAGNKAAVISWNRYLTICCLHRKKKRVHVRHHSGVTEVIAAFQMFSKLSPLFHIRTKTCKHTSCRNTYILLSYSSKCFPWVPLSPLPKIKPFIFLKNFSFWDENTDENTEDENTEAFEMKILEINFVGEGGVFMQVHV